jgi:transposase-like protein
MNSDDYNTGRPSSFTEEKASRVIEAVRRGLPYKHAAAYAGISYSTLNRWRIEGRDEDGLPEFREFWKQLEQAAGEASLRMIDAIEEAAERDWKAAAWILSRRHPEQWGQNTPRPSDPTEPLFPL